MNKRTLVAIAVVGVMAASLVFLGGAVGCSKGNSDSGTHAVATTGGSTAPSSQFVNDHCPIMGDKIDPANVPASLTRDYKGQKVAFCCAMCPPAWDKLSDAEKDKKLDAVRAK
jgi:hypothetical protein